MKKSVIQYVNDRKEEIVNSNLSSEEKIQSILELATFARNHGVVLDKSYRDKFFKIVKEIA